MSFLLSMLGPLYAEIIALRDRHLHTLVKTADNTGAVVFGTPGFRHHLSRVYLETDAPLKTRWRLHPSNPKAALQESVRTFGLAVAPVGLLPVIPLLPAIQIPQYVGLFIDLPANPADFRRNLPKGLAHRIRKLKSSDFVFHSTRDPEMVECFRKNHLNATTSLRHGRETFFVTRENLREKMSNPDCCLIQLLHRGQWVAGAIRCEEQNAYRSIWVGWKDGDPGILRSGVVTALYMETIERAYERGKKRVFLGGTLPYLEDGVFAFKAKWNARIDPNMNVYQRMAWYLDPTHPQVRRFLERSSVVACGHNGRIVVYSAQAPKTGQTYRETLRSISAWYRLRETPGSSSASTHPDVPSALRPWFEPCLPSSSPVSSVL